MSFRFRLLISFTLLVALSLGIGGTILITTSFQNMLNEEKTAAIDSFESIQNNLMMLSYFGEGDKFENMSEMLEQMDEQKMARWQAISLTSNQQVVYESGNLSLLSTEFLFLDSEQYAYTVAADDLGRRLQICSKLSTGKTEFLLNASYDLTSAYAVRENQQRMFLVIYVVVVLLGMAMAGVLSFVLTRHLRKLTIAARQITGGELSQRSNIRTEDEFGQLSRDFDVMADKLQDHILCLQEDVQRKEDFMGAVAHELKTPMTSIIGYADLIRQCSLNEKNTMAAANYIFTEGKRLEKLSVKLLDLLLLEKDNLSMKEVNLNVFLKDVLSVFVPMAEEKQVRLSWKGEPVKVILEPDLIKSLLYNLVDNAIKAMDEGGNILVKGRAIPGGLEIQVFDNGCGMEKEELSKITEAFYRVDKSRSRQQGGAGLGLSLCKKIVELHHGNMTFHSVKGKGSCVIVELYGSREDINEKI